MASAAPAGLELNGRTFGMGKHVTRVPVTTDLNGGAIDLVLHAIVGRRPGPTLLVSSTLHGGEWVSIDVVRRLVERLDPEAMAGSVIAMPVANPTAFGQMTRSTPDESDNVDLNRVFPGAESWITEQLAATITREVLVRVDALMDFHYGGWGNTFGVVSHGTDYPDAAVSARSRELALAFGFPLVRGQVTKRFPGPGSMVGYAGAVLGVPGVIGGVGGVGFDAVDEERWIEINVAGCINMMTSLGILAGTTTRGRTLEFTKMHRVNPSVGGFLKPVRDHDAFGREVVRGEVLGHVVSPYTRAVLETLEAPCDGYLMYYPRWYPVRPGDWAFGVIDKDDPGSVWLEAAEAVAA
jgi:uncharacterized protein